MTDDQLEIENKSHSLPEDEYSNLKSAYQKLRSEHLMMKKGIVTTVQQCWTKIDRQYNCKNSMSESLNRLGSVDVVTVAADELLGDLKTQIETMLRQVYLNCEINKSLELSKLKEQKTNSEPTDVSEVLASLDKILQTVDAFNNMLDNVTLQRLVTNAPDETHSGRIDLSNKTIVQMLNSMKSIMENPATDYPKQLKDLRSQCFELLSSKGNLIMMWNNQFLTCIQQVDSATRQPFRRPRLLSNSRRVGTEVSRVSCSGSPKASSPSNKGFICLPNSTLPDARIRGYL